MRCAHHHLESVLIPLSAAFAGTRYISIKSRIFRAYDIFTYTYAVLSSVFPSVVHALEMDHD